MKSHHLFGNCQRHRSCACFYALERRFQKHLNVLVRSGKYDEADRKRAKFSHLIAAEYAFSRG